MTKAGHRLRSARERLELTPQEVASAAGINLPSYFDLEEQEGELYSALSLGELRALCHKLRIKPAHLFREESDPSVAEEAIDFSRLAERINRYLIENDQSQATFESKVGWYLGGFLSSPEIASEWNVDCLRDICQELQIDWIRALPS